MDYETTLSRERTAYQYSSLLHGLACVFLRQGLKAALGLALGKTNQGLGLPRMYEQLARDAEAVARELRLILTEHDSASSTCADNLLNVLAGGEPTGYEDEELTALLGELLSRLKR